MGVKRSEGAKAPFLRFATSSGICGGTPPTSRCVVQRFGNLRDGVQYGAFAANLRNDLANRRWNIGGRISGQSCQHDHYATTTLHVSQ